jgi:CRP/FNR family transcriptional regulator
MTGEERARLVERFPSLAALPAPDQATLLQRGVLRTLPKGAVYLREGDSCAGIALLLDGRIRVSKSAESGREITLYHIEPGETCILTASCLLAGTRYPATAVAADTSVAALLPGAFFRRLVDTAPAVREFVFDHFSERLAAVMALVEEVAFRGVDRRLARWLASEASARPGPVLLSHEELAAHIGTARVVVSRVLAEFESRGWLRLGRRRVEVLSREALAAFGNQGD